jgi:predicted dehydrogenase
MNQKLGFGIVGGGLIGKVHAAAINAIPGAAVVAVWGRNAERAQELAAKYNATGYTDYAQFLAHPGLDIVNVCSPSGLHLEHGQAAAAAGKHVLVEKPLEINLERADALIAACAAAGVQLGVIFQSRFLPAIQKMKAAIEAGKLGRLLLGDAYVKWYRAPEYYADSWHGTLALDGGGALINQAIHTIDLLRWMMGPVAAATAMKKALRYPHIEAEDTLVGTLEFENGALGAVVATTSVKPGFKRRLEISGERGTIILDGDAISVWEIEGDAQSGEAAEQITDGSSNPAAISTEGHRRQIADMLHAVRENRAPVIDGHEGRKSLEVVLALYRAAEQRCLIQLS